MVDNVEFLFDEVEPSPVFESDEMFYNVVDKCPSFSESSTSVDGAELFIEASTSKSFSVKVTVSEKDALLLECDYCYGYTTMKLRCKNRKKLNASSICDFSS